MKFTAEQAIEALKGAGVEGAEIVDDAAASTYDQDTFLQAIDTARTPIIKGKIINEVRDEQRTSIAGEVGKNLTKLLKKHTGIDAKELDNKTDEEKMEMALSHLKGSLGKDTEETRKQFDDMLRRHNDKEEQWRTEKETLDRTWKEKYTSREMEDYYYGKLQNAPLPEGADRKILARQWLGHMRENYHLEYDEATKEVKYFKKDNPEIPALNEKETGNLDDISVAKSFFEPMGIWRKDMRDVSPADKMKQMRTTDYNNPNKSNDQQLSDVDQLNKARSEYFQKQTA